MLIKSIRIKGFRSILDETLQCDNLTALVGANGTGKSSFLKALDLFYSPSPKLDAEDFYNGETNSEIVVGITFTNLSDEAKDKFSIYLQGDKLTVERVFVWENGKISWKYHGASLQCSAFQQIRDGLIIKDRGKTAKEAYERIRSLAEYSALPAWSKIEIVLPALREWEARNPEKCVRQRDDGQFFGFKEVAQGYLGRYTRFLFIPAIRDASEDTCEAKGSVLTSLMDLVVRSVIANKEALIKLKEETQHQYQKILDPAKLGELTTLQEQLTTTLTTYVPDAKVELRWLPLSDIDIPLPEADVKLIEDGYSSAVSRTGHGLQRAFILTLLQHLALAQSIFTHEETKSENEAKNKPTMRLPNLVLAIEEPELYQHPNRQRHLANILYKLATGKTPGVAEKTQIIYATHSPLFVSLDRIEQLRLLRKIPNGLDKPKITRIISTTLDRVAEEIWRADGSPSERYTGRTLFPRLQTIMTPWMSEGFFADVAVLVEGEDDRAAILGVAKAEGYDLESSGYSIIPCGGKTCLDRPAVIFKQLNIPVYLIWDGDKDPKDAHPEYNHRLLRLLDQPVVDWPIQIHAHFACFEKDLETTLAEEIDPDLFEELLTKCRNDFSIPKRKHAVKNPIIIATIIQKAQEQGKTSNSLRNIVNNIIALKK